MNRKKKNSPKQGKIIQGGMLVPQGMRQPDIVLQMPEIFRRMAHFAGYFFVLDVQ